MQLHKEKLVMLLFIFYSTHKTSAGPPTTDKFQIIVPEKSSTPTQNKTIDTLVQEQTDLIKKIVSNHKTTTIDYPIVTKKEAEIKQDPRIKEEQERLSIEELRKKCQEALKLNIQNIQTTARSETKISTVEVFGPTRKPEFLQKPKIERGTETTPVLSHHQNQNVFVTKTVPMVPGSPNILSQTIHNPINGEIGYVQRDPVVLEHQMLTNGRRLYYWYSPYPITEYYVALPVHQTQSYRGSDSSFKYPSQQFVNNLVKPYPNTLNSSIIQNWKLSNMQNFQVQAQNHALQVVNPPIQVANPPIRVKNRPIQVQTQPIQVQNQPIQVQNHPIQVQNHPIQVQNHPIQVQNHPIQVQNHPNKVQNHPNQAQNHPIQVQKPPIQVQNPLKQVQNPPTQVQNPQIRPQIIKPLPEVIPNYEIVYTTTEKTIEDNLKKQMKFVIPVPYPTGEISESTARFPWQFDPYAYYPKSLQPSTINVPLPYLPTFHMIRALRVPNYFIQQSNNGNNFENNKGLST